MKNIALRFFAVALVAVLLLPAFAACGNSGMQGLNTDEAIEDIRGDKGDKGDKGDRGDKGDAGENGITPQLRINPTTKMWEVSYDKGVNWTSLGVVATGSKGETGAEGKTPSLRINSVTNIWEVSYDKGVTWTSLGIGATGASGEDGKTPALRINSSTNMWEVSYDQGVNWTSLGVVATGAKGDDGITPMIRINPSTSMWEVSYDNGATWASLGVSANGSGSNYPSIQPPGTQATVTETYTSKVDPSKVDFGGEQIAVLTREDEAYRREWGKAEDAAASDLSVIESRIEVRNAKVMNDLNIDVVLYTSVTTTFDDYLLTMQQAVIDDVSTYSGQFDIVANFAYGAGYATLRGIQANLMDEDLFPYFDFTLPCWNQSIVKNITLNDKLYVIFGDANLSAFDGANVIWCNKTLYDEYKASFAAPEDIQQHVLDGNWTWNDFQAWGDLYEKGYSEEACSGTHGVAIDVWLPDALYYSFDLDLITRTSDNRFQYNIFGNTQAESALNDLREFMPKEGVMATSLLGGKKECTCGNGYVSHFVNDETVFYVSILYSNASSDMITNMESEYFVMPMPKYEASQANYGTTSVDCYNLVSISNHNDLNGELLSAYLQYLNDESYTKIRAHYINKIVKGTFLGADYGSEMLEKSEKILDNILTNLEYDMATIYSNSLCDIMWMWRDIVRTEYDLETAFVFNNLSNGGEEKNQAMYEDAIEDFNSWIYADA